jgi:hypothetical protein
MRIEDDLVESAQAHNNRPSLIPVPHGKPTKRAQHLEQTEDLILINARGKDGDERTHLRSRRSGLLTWSELSGDIGRCEFTLQLPLGDVSDPTSYGPNGFEPVFFVLGIWMAVLCAQNVVREADDRPSGCETVESLGLVVLLSRCISGPHDAVSLKEQNRKRKIEYI